MFNDLPEDNPWKIGIVSTFENEAVGTVTTTKPITLQPMENRTVNCFVRKKFNVKSALTEQLEGLGGHTAIVCPRIVEIRNRGKNARVPVRLCNLTDKPIKIKAKAELCRLNDETVLRNISEDERFVESATIEKKNEVEEDMKGKYGVDLDDTVMDEEQKRKVYNLFEKWNVIFPKHKLDIGHTKEVKHTIKIHDNQPFKEPVRRIPPAVFEEVREHLKEMVKIGAIRESKTPWTSNVVIVRKKDGTIRFCIDYRKLNNRTKKDNYAKPRIEDTLHLLSGAQYFSKLDLKSGYWQIELAEEDNEKTAFQVAGLGFYE